MVRLANFGLIGFTLATLIVQLISLFPALRIVVYAGIAVFAAYFAAVLWAIRQMKWELTPLTARHLGIALAIALLSITGAVAEGGRRGDIGGLSSVPQNR